MTWYHTYYIIPGALFILSILFIFEIIGPNDTVGIRIGKAVWNENNWYKVHKFTGWSMLISSVITYVYLILLYVCKKYISPDLDARSLYALGVAFFSIIGVGVIPMIYNVSIPDSHTKEETSFNFDQLKSTFAMTIYVWLCLLLIFVSIPWLLNMVEPNTSSGIRVSTTLASEENWYKAHYFDSLTRIIGCCITLISILFMKLFFRKSTAWYNNGLVYLLVFLVPLFLCFFISTVYHTFILKVP